MSKTAKSSAVKIAGDANHNSIERTVAPKPILKAWRGREEIQRRKSVVGLRMRLTNAEFSENRLRVFLG